MIRDIYIQMGNVATLYPLLQFHRHNKEFLEARGIYSPVIKDLVQDCSANLHWTEGIGHFWLCDSMQGWYSQACGDYAQSQGILPTILPQTKELMASLLEYLENKPHIHTLHFFLNYFYLDSDIFSFFTALKETFPDITMHPKMTFLPPDRELEGYWINELHFFSPTSLALLVEATTYLGSFLLSPNKRKKTLAAFLQQDVATLQIMNEDASLSAWQQWVNIPTQSPSQKYTSLFASPEVLAFIISVQKRTYPNNQQYSWFQEEAFFSYNLQEDVPKSYLRPFWRAKIRSNYDTLSTVAFNYQEDRNIHDVSNDSLGLSIKNALTLAALLSSAFRQRILHDLDQPTLKYQPQSVRNAYGALLFIEGQIDKKALELLTQAPKGTCLPAKEISHFEEGMSAPKVMVLTMTYNHRAFIEKNIQSVLEQITNFPVVHLIRDDASTDGTREIILEYAARYPHIKPILNNYNNGGNIALEFFDQVSSPYVSLCDGDDYFHDPQKLQKQADYLDRNPRAGLCFHPVMTLFEDKPGIGRIYPPLELLPRGIQAHYYLRELLNSNFIQTNSVMYRWRFPKGLPAWFAYRFCPEDRYWHLLHAECGKIGFQNEIMSVYRRHPTSLFAQTEISTVKHRQNFGIDEVKMYQIIDLHFEGLFADSLHSLAWDVLQELAKDAAKTKDASHLRMLIERFPMFNQYVQKVPFQ